MRIEFENYDLKMRAKNKNYTAMNKKKRHSQQTVRTKNRSPGEMRQIYHQFTRILARCLMRCESHFLFKNKISFEKS